MKVKGGELQWGAPVVVNVELVGEQQNICEMQIFNKFFFRFFNDLSFK